MTAYLWNFLVALDQLANALLAPALNAVLRPTAARIKNKTRVAHAE